MSKAILARVLPLLSATAALLLAPASGAEEPAGALALTEAEVVSKAVAQNPGLRASVLELESAEWGVVAEEVRYAFVLQIDGGVTRTASPGLIPGGVSTAESYSAEAGAELRKRLLWGTDLSFRLGGSWQLSDAARRDLPGALGPAYGTYARFSVVQPLLRGSGREVGEADILVASARRTSAERARDRTASELLRSVVTAYWELWYADAVVGIQEQSRAVAIQQRDDAAARVKVGALAPADVLSFETRVATRDEDVLNAQVERQRRQAELSRQIGALREGSTLGLPSEDVPPTPAPPPADTEKAALAESVQLRELEAALELARLQARTAEDPQRSRLDLDAYVQADGLGNDEVGPAVKQLGTLGAVSAHVGLTYETPLDDSGRRAAAARARLAVDVAAQRLAEARQSVLSEVRTALTSEAAARRRLALAEETTRIAERQLEAERARFQTGASTALAILTAEDEVRSAQLRVARVRAELLEASLTLQHLTGRLLARYGSLAQGGVSTAGGGRRRGASLGPRVGLF